MFQVIQRSLRAALADEKGLTAVEYGVMATAIILAIVGVVGQIGGNLSTAFQSVAGAL